MTLNRWQTLAFLPLIAAVSLTALLAQQSTGRFSWSNFVMAGILANLWFWILFFPIARPLARVETSPLMGLTLWGALSCGVCACAVLYLFLGMLGHGGTHMNLSATFLGAGAFGVSVGAITGLAFGVIYRPADSES